MLVVVWGQERNSEHLIYLRVVLSSKDQVGGFSSFNGGGVGTKEEHKFP